MTHASDTLVVIAAYREAAVIGDVVRELCAAGWAVLVVDDGSPDATADRARAAGATVLRHALNLGQGAALQTGFEHACELGVRTVITFDADGQHREEDIAALCAAIADGADVALGSRGMGGTEGATAARRGLLRCATWLGNRLSGVQLTDSHCGLRAIRAAVLPQLRLRCDGSAHASELVTRASQAGLRIVEVPVVVRYTDYSRAKGQRAIAAARILFDLLVRARVATEAG